MLRSRVAAALTALTLLAGLPALAQTAPSPAVPQSAPGAAPQTVPAPMPAPMPAMPAPQTTAPTPRTAPLPAPDPTLLLRPGQYLWYDDVPTDASSSADRAVSIVVSLPGQMAYVYRGSALIGMSTVSTGKPGKTTPTGNFTILQKKVFHRSNLYSNAPMPFMQRLTWDGIALHAGHNPGYPASHGCIRLPKDFAKHLFDLTAMGGRVAVVNYMIDDPDIHPLAPPPIASSGGAGSVWSKLKGSADRR